MSPVERPLWERPRSAPRTCVEKELSPPSFWQRRVRDPLLTQLTQGTRPEQLALTVGFALVGGLLPLFVVPTALCFLFALAFRLNQPVIHLVNQLLSPLHLLMIAVYVKLGAALYGAPALPFDAELVARIFFESPREFWARFGLLALHAGSAWLLSTPLLFVVGYYGSLPLLRRLAARPPRVPQ